MSWTHREKYLKEQLAQPGSRKLSLWLLYTCCKYHILSFREAQMDMDTHDLRSEETNLHNLETLIDQPPILPSLSLYISSLNIKFL